MCIILLEIYVFKRQKETFHSLIHSPKWLQQAKAGPGRSYEPGTPSRLSSGMVGTYAFEPSPAALQTLEQGAMLEEELGTYQPRDSNRHYILFWDTVSQVAA